MVINMDELKNSNTDMNSSSQQLNRQMQRNMLKMLFSVDDSPLTPEQQTSLAEYWGRLSNRKYQVDPIYCKFYTERTGWFDPRYIPDDFQYDYLESKTVNFDYVKAFTDKNYVDLILSGAKMPEAVVRCVNGAYLDKDFKAISKDEALALLEVSKPLGLIKRASVGNSANQILKFGKESTRENLAAMLSLAGGNNFVIQRLVKQHKDMLLFSGNTSTCISVLSVRNTKSVVIISAVACIRDHGIRVNDKDVGKIYCGIDKLGRFRNLCFSYKGKLLDNEVLGTDPGGRVIKPYDRILQTVREYHEKLPQFGVAEWDFMVNEDNEPVLIGYKAGKVDIHFHQLCNGPLYGEMTDSLVAAAFGNKVPIRKPVKEKISPAELKIISQPGSVSCIKGETAKFSVKAEGLGLGLEYQWYYRINERGLWAKSSQSDAETAELEVAAKSYRNGYQYRCRITDVNGNTVYSEAAVLEIIK